MKNFSKGLFGFIIALCFTLTAFCSPSTPTPNNDVGYSCVNQTFPSVVNIDYTALPVPVATHFITALTNGNDQFLNTCSKVFLNDKQPLPVPKNQINQGLFRLDIGETKPIFMVYIIKIQRCDDQINRGIYCPNIGYTISRSANTENRFTALFTQADAASKRIYVTELSKLNPANPTEITPVPLL